MDRLKDIGLHLLHWYNENKRDLPWRKTKDPYKIWISEIMLQQTRVDTVIEYYLRFLKRFPDVFKLSEAREEDVLSAWKGLGYYTRARNLQKAADFIVKNHGGVFPSTFEDIRRLPGIGEYTAGAVLSIAFNQEYPAVDGNVLRVISRIEGLEEDIGKEKVKKGIGEIVLKMMPEGNASDFNQSLMELGALICIPVNPICRECPVNGFCIANLTERQNELPFKIKKEKNTEPIEYWVAVIQDKHHILMEFRSRESLLGRMWGFPMIEKNETEEFEKQFEEKYGLKLKKKSVIGTTKHVFTHQVWKMIVVRCELEEKHSFASELRWISEEEQKELPIPTAFQRVFKLLDNENGWEQMELET
ncbi:MAG: A/G-specific adenine glycosylase [Clostridia bacterium]|nr:A/G-specific adenine glycosylase [Clostridia bacterium]